MRKRRYRPVRQGLRAGCDIDAITEDVPFLDHYVAHVDANAELNALVRRRRSIALGQLGRTAEAKEALEKAITIAPASFDMFVRQRVPWHRPEDYAHMLEGLRKAGWEG